MGRCDRRCMAIGIKRSLSKIDKMMVMEAMKIEVDALMYEFARLHGIGVIPDEISNSTTLYTFLSDPESHIDTGFRMKLVFANHCVNVNWDNVDGSYLDRALKQVTIYLNLRNWEEYLEPDYVIPPTRLTWDPLHPEKTHHDDSLDAMRYMLPCVPRTRMLDLSTGGPTREALERMRRTSQDVDVDSMYPKLSDSILRYCKEDWKSTMELYKRLEEEKKNTIKKVIFHDPATIIYWEDGTKTVVKVQNGEKFDPEKGMAMAICKKTHGNDGSYYEAFKKFLPKEEKPSSGVLNFMECLTVFEKIQNLEIAGPQPETGIIRMIDRRNSDKQYLVVERDTIQEEKWQELRDYMLNYFKKSPITVLPMDLEESTDAITIDTEAEQYTGEAPKVRMCERTIDEELKEFAAISGLTVNYEPKTGRYYIFKRQHCKPFVYKADSPEKKLSCLEWAKLQDDIFKYFDI